MKCIFKRVGALVVGSGVLFGCTSILGSFDVVGAGEPLSDVDASGVDGTDPGVDGSTFEDAGDAADADVPLVCAADETKCVAEHACAKLPTDGEHCGKCGHSCGGGQCVAGECKPFKLYEAAPDGGTATVGPIDVSATKLFFATSEGFQVHRLLSCPSATGCTAPPKQLVLMTYGIASIASVHEQTIAFQSAPAQSTERDTLYACSPAGCPGVPSDFAMDGLNGIQSRLRVAGDRLFYNRGGYGVGFATCPVTDGGTCGDTVNLGSMTRGTVGFATDALNVYFVDSSSRGSTIAKCAQTDASCTPTTVVAGSHADVQGLSVDGGKLYWIEPGRVDFDEGKLMTCDLPACATTTRLAQGLATSTDSDNELFVDASGAYWFTTTHKLQRCAPGGCIGGVQDFVAGPLDSPHAIVADASFVYWAEKSSVWRLAKK